MGGTLILYDTKAGDDDERDEDIDSFSYSYSGFHWFKGEILRAGIRYLKSLQADEKSAEHGFEGVVQPYIDAGVLPSHRNVDEESFDEANRRVGAALHVLNGWIRNVKGRDRFDNRWNRLLSMGANRQQPPDLQQMLDDFKFLDEMKNREPDPDEMLDNSYRMMAIQRLLRCPTELDQAGMRGMYDFMKLPDNSQEIFPREAKEISILLDKVQPFVLDETSQSDRTNDLVSMLKELRDLCNACVGDKVIRG
ncbi:hypothetical protein ABKN59_007355 [Abortiporus biennis]